MDIIEPESTAQVTSKENTSESLPSDFPETLKKLAGLQRSGDGWVTQCPAPTHQGNARLVIRFDPGGGYCVRCEGGCSGPNVAAALENLPVLALIDGDEISIPATESAGEPRKTASRIPPNAASSVLVGEPTGFILHGASGDRKHLSNFLARIARQEIHDDGATEQRFYHIEATRQRQDAARNMIRVEEEQRLVVPAREFEDMSWVPDKLGANFQIFIPGRRGRDLVAKAILFASGRGDVPTDYLYRHTGWRQVNGLWCYLHGGGAIGNSQVRTDLTAEGLHRYALPTPSPDDIRTAIGCSLGLLSLGRELILYPLLAAVYRAPLAHHVPCTVMPHLVGASGLFKSTLAALFLGHYGNFPGKEDLPGNWRSTQASLEKLLFLTKDALIVVDDLYPEEADMERKKMEATFSRVAGAVGDAKGRGRLNSAMDLRPEYFPRGVVLSTGEYTPRFSQSRQARVLTIPIQQPDISAPRLTKCQRTASMLKVALAGYVDSLRQDFDDLGSRLRTEFEALRNGFGTDHPRVAENAAHLMLGLSQFLRFASECVAISARTAEAHLDRGKDACLELARQQSADVREYSPVGEFIQVIREALTARKAYLVRRQDRAFSEGGNDTELLGYEDDDGVYLLPETAFKFVNKFLREKGLAPLNDRHIKRSLLEGGLLFNCEPGRYDRTTRCEGKSVRVMWIKRDALLDPAPATQGPEHPGEAMLDVEPEVLQ